MDNVGYKLLLINHTACTGFSSEIGTKLSDWAVGQAGGSCYSRAAQMTQRPGKDSILVRAQGSLQPPDNKLVDVMIGGSVADEATVVKKDLYGNLRIRPFLSHRRGR